MITRQTFSIFYLFTFLLCNIYLYAQLPQFTTPPVLFDPPLSSRIANYDVDVRLDTDKKLLAGKEMLTWKNTSSDEITELQFYLYLNAFRNNRSTFMIEAGRRYWGVPENEDGWGYIEINRMVLLDREHFRDNPKGFRHLIFRNSQIPPDLDLTGKMEYIQPDTPEHIYDKTVLRVTLPEPLLPGDSLRLWIDFTAKLPEPPYARTGAEKEFYMVGQWFPKTGVYTERGWNCHQYHTNSEFFADFGVYNVWITVPEKNIVGATGIRVGEPLKNDDSTATHYYHAEDVHDFAWTTSPEFVEFKGRTQDVDIRALMQPDHAAQGPRHVEAAKVAIEYFQNWYGDYPYPNVTVVDPRRGAGETGGMEYPTLFTTETFYGIPEGIRIPEMVVIHEFGHNYWHGMVASNEFEETWLDEGITNYCEIQIMNDYYGPNGDLIDFLGIKVNDRQYQRFAYIFAPDLDPTVRKAWEYYSGTSYGVNSYDKPAMMLTTLQNYLGRETMNRIMRAYFERWKFKHPHSQDFIDVANDVSGQNLSRFFERALYTNDVLDYSVDRLITRRYVPEKGFDFQFSTMEEDSMFSGFSGQNLDSLTAMEQTIDSLDTAQVDSEKTGTKPELYESVVSVRRLGDFTFPVEVEAVFENGEIIRETWDGEELWKKFRYIRPARLVSAAVDPDNKLVLDINFTNNSRAIEKRPLGINKISMRWLFWTQFLLDQPDFLNLFTAPIGFN